MHKKYTRNAQASPSTLISHINLAQAIHHSGTEYKHLLALGVQEEKGEVENRKRKREEAVPGARSRGTVALWGSAHATTVGATGRKTHTEYPPPPCSSPSASAPTPGCPAHAQSSKF